MVLDLEGFMIENKFVVRELGYYAWTGDHGRMAFYPPMTWNELSPKDRKTVWFVKYHVHGLTFSPMREEQAHPQSLLTPTLLSLYESFKTEKLNVVAYKGGRVEMDLLNSLHIPSVNLESYGCPRFDSLLSTIVEPLPNCGFHCHCPNGHCSMVECHAYWLWMITNM